VVGPAFLLSSDSHRIDPFTKKDEYHRVNASPESTNRLLSLDALRGYTIALMVIVNDPGSWSHVYPPLLHSEWNGVTITDIVFPFFLFIVGTSIALAYTKRLNAGASPRELYGKTTSRAIKILLLGWFLALWPNFHFGAMRFPGVLPRIAVVFFICALIFLNTTWRQQVWIAVCLLVGYWLLMAFVPVPIDDIIRDALVTGHVQASEGLRELGPIHQISSGFIAANYEPGVNITAWLDRLLLPGRFWEVTWDPEGLMSTFPAIATGIIGMLIGKLILSITDPHKKLTWMFFVGFALYLAGGVWGWVMPLNKNLWTSSYTLWTAGMCTMGLAASMLVIDVLGYQRGTKLGQVYGANAITSYVLSGMLTLVFYSAIFGETSLNDLWMNGLTNAGVAPKLASFGYAVLYMLIIYIPAYVLYKKRIFIRV
jgi:predicted acyltransferase